MHIVSSLATNKWAPQLLQSNVHRSSFGCMHAHFYYHPIILRRTTTRVPKTVINSSSWPISFETTDIQSSGSSLHFECRIHKLNGPTAFTNPSSALYACSPDLNKHARSAHSRSHNFSPSAGWTPASWRHPKAILCWLVVDVAKQEWRDETLLSNTTGRLEWA